MKFGKKVTTDYSKGYCDECGGVFRVDALQWVETRFITSTIKYYCVHHRKPYDKVVISGSVQYFKRQSEWRRVNPDGTDYVHIRHEEHARGVSSILRAYFQRR